MWDIMRSEFYKVKKSRVTWVTLFVFLAVAVIQIAAVIYAKLRSENWEMIIQNNGISVFGEYPSGSIYFLLVALFVSGIVSSEYTTGTVKQIVSRGVPRVQIVVGQYISLCVAVTVITFVPSLILTGVYSLAWGFGSISVGRFLLLVLAQFVVIWSYVALSMLISHITRSGGLSVGINLIILMLGSLAAMIVSELMGWSWVYEYWFINMQSEALDYTLNVGRQCKFILLLLLGGAGCAGLSALLFGKRDVQ